MTDLASLIIAADSSQVRTAKADLDRLNQAGPAAQQTAKAISDANARTAQSYRELSAAITRADLAAADKAARQSATGLGMYATAARDAEVAAKSHSRSVTMVANDLAFEMAQLQRSSREQAIHNRLRAAGVDATSAEGRHIAALAARHHDMTVALGRTSAASATFEAAASGNVAAVGVMAAQFARAHPIIVAFSVAGGATVAVLTTMTRSANEFADSAGRLVDASETIGISTTRLQQLVRVGAEVGVSQDQLNTALERFSFSWRQLRDGSGELLNGLLVIDAGLAQQLATARTAAEAWDIYARARARANEADRVRLDRAAFGRGGGPVGRVAGATDEAGGIDRLRESNILLHESLRLWDQLKDQSDIAGKIASERVKSIFTGNVLESQRAFNLAWLEFLNSAEKSKSIPETFGRGMVAAYKMAIEWTPAARLLRPFDVPVHIVASLELVAKRSATLRDMMPGMEAAAERLRVKNNLLAKSNDLVAESMQSVAARGERMISFLGDASTPMERYNQRMVAINAAIEKNSELESQRSRMQDEAGRQFRIDTLQIRLGLLGNTISIVEQLRVKEEELNKAIDYGNITRQEANKVLALERASLLGVTQMGTQTDQARIEAQTLGMAIGPATAYRLEHERLARARREGMPLAEADIAAIRKEAQEAGGAAAALAKLKMQKDLVFERGTLLLSEEDARIAERLRGLYGDDIPAALASTEAAAIRALDRLRMAKDLTTDAATGVVRDFIQAGRQADKARADAYAAFERSDKSAEDLTKLRSTIAEIDRNARAWERLKDAGMNALERISDKLMDMATRRLVDSAFGSSSGLLSVLFGGGGATATTDPAAYVGAVGQTGVVGPAWVAHGGGEIGRTRFPTRMVDPSVFDGAPSYARGSLPRTIGGDEVPIIAHRKEVIGSPQQMRQAFGGGGPTTIALTVHVEGTGDKELMANMRAGAQAAVHQALAEYDRHVLPARVADISERPDRR